MNELSMARSLMSKTQTNPGQTTTAYGIATGGSVNGLVMVNMGGDTISPDDDQSIECETTFKVFEGDEVIVSLVGADGTGKTPTVVGVVGRGDQMQSEIDNVKNYFWTNDRGAHVSTIEHSIAGNNVLIDADSLDIRYGNTNDENDQILLARFGRNTAYIGGIDGIPYWTIKDLRDGETKVAIIEDVKYGDGYAYNIQTDFDIKEVVSVKKNGTILVDGEDYTVNLSTSTVTFDNVLAVGDTIIIRYATENGVFSYSEGIRNASNNDGVYSKTVGFLNSADGTYSEAHGYNTSASGWGAVSDGYMTTANSDLQKVFGRGNISDNNNKYAEIVGNGMVKVSDIVDTIQIDASVDGYELSYVPIEIIDMHTAKRSGASPDTSYFTNLTTTFSVDTISYQSRDAIGCEVTYTFDPLPYKVHVMLRGNGTYQSKSSATRSSWSYYSNEFTINAGQTSVKYVGLVYVNGRTLSDFRLSSATIGFQGAYEFIDDVTINGKNVTIPNVTHNSESMNLVVSYTYGSYSKNNAYNLDWDGNAEFEGIVSIGGCTPNGETPYPVTRFHRVSNNDLYQLEAYVRTSITPATWAWLPIQDYCYNNIHFGEEAGLGYSCIGTGFITDSGKQIFLRFVLPRTVIDSASVTSIDIGMMEGGMRGIKGYINSTGYNTDWYTILEGSGYSYTGSVEGNLVYIKITKSSAFSNYTNNTPIVFEPINMIIYFNRGE